MAETGGGGKFKINVSELLTDRSFVLKHWGVNDYTYSTVQYCYELVYLRASVCPALLKLLVCPLCQSRKVDGGFLYLVLYSLDDDDVLGAS